MRRLRTTTVLGAAAGLVFALVPLGATAAAPTTRIRPVHNGVSTVNWDTCASSTLQQFGAECAMVDVPLDYSHPNGTKIQLAISRIKHTVPDSEYQGVMLVNPGGPGGSGLTLSVLGQFVPNGAGDDYDWIGFDPRGVGSSVPAVSCNPQYFGFNRPPYVPSSGSIERAWLKKANGYAADCGKNNGAILQHLTTIESVRDMDSIRKALGAAQINYYGFSYGTYLGQVYGTLFPSRVRRMVLDSNVDPTRVWYQANLDQDYAFDRNINIWFGWLAKYDSVYHLGSTEAAVRKLWYATQAKLAAHPADGKIGAAEWTDIFLFAGYYQATWTDLADTFAGYIHNNDVANLEQHYIDANGLGDDNGYAVYLGVQCTDVQWPRVGHSGNATTGARTTGLPSRPGGTLGTTSRAAPGLPQRTVRSNRRQQGRKRTAHRRDTRCRDPVLGKPRGSRTVPTRQPDRAARRHLARELTLRRRLPGRPNRGVPRERHLARATTRGPRRHHVCAAAGARSRGSSGPSSGWARPIGQSARFGGGARSRGNGTPVAAVTVRN